MIDIIGAISLTALFGLCAALLITAIPVDAAARSRVAAIAIAWFAGVGSLGALGTFSADGFGTVAIGMAVLDTHRPVAVLGGTLIDSAESGSQRPARRAGRYPRGTRAWRLLPVAPRGGTIASHLCIGGRVGRHRRGACCLTARLGDSAPGHRLANDDIRLESVRVCGPGDSGHTRRWISAEFPRQVYLRKSQLERRGIPAVGDDSGGPRTCLSADPPCHLRATCAGYCREASQAAGRRPCVGEFCALRDLALHTLARCRQTRGHGLRAALSCTSFSAPERGRTWPEVQRLLRSTPVRWNQLPIGFCGGPCRGVLS